MAKLPNVKRISREDLPDAPDWVEHLLAPLNLFLEFVFGALDKNLTLVDNVQAQIRNIEFQTSSAYDGTAANFETQSFQKGIPTKADGLILMQIIQVEDNHTPIEDAVRLDWLEDNGVINIFLVTGLLASKSYQLRVLLV